MNLKLLMYARINEIAFSNFRNIKDGKIEFPNSDRAHFLGSEEPSILGLYGQNGSGKTSVIMALSILKDVLSGKSLNHRYLSCIKYGEDRCSLEFRFSMFAKVFNEEGDRLNEPNETPFLDVYYNFDIVGEENKDGLIDNEYHKGSKTEKVLRIKNEVLKYKSIAPTGKILVQKQTVIDTREAACGKQKNAFGPKDKYDNFVFTDSNLAQEFKDSKAIAYSNSQSFIFATKTINCLAKSIENLFQIDEVATMIKKINDGIQENEDLASVYENPVKENPEILGVINYYGTVFNIIYNLRLFGSEWLQIVDTTITGQTNINSTLPLLLWNKFHCEDITLEMDKPTMVSESSYKGVEESVKGISAVLTKIVPGLELEFVDLGYVLSKSDEKMHSFDILSKREGTIIPLKYESDGVRRIVSILSLLVAAFNELSFTIVIDEFDSGIYEYLLGEILLVFSESAKGQLIFTSHNLRPLEVLPPQYLCFTTTNPANRFIKIPKRGNSNLRDTYFRSIILNKQKEEVYSQTDSYDIKLAFYKAGHGELNDG
nr:AAA family ATPase [Clostridia bacterium]